jgi:Ca2+-binding RTX toxin-like protein
VVLRGRAGDDRLRVDAEGCNSLPAGDARLVGGPGDDMLFGGSGADRLAGRDGDDRLLDASLRDFVAVFRPTPPPTVPAGRARDSFDGGAGSDTVSYSGRRSDLRINLSSSRPIAGARGERDSIRRVENAEAGDGDDRIAGNGEANYLLGQQGDDLIVGYGGPDRIEGAEGDNVIHGGAGNDLINAPPIPTANRVSCGSGRDDVGSVFHHDFISDNCERLSLSEETESLLAARLLRMHLPIRARQSPRVLTGTLRCIANGLCQVRAEVRVVGPVTRRGSAPPAGTLLGSQTLTDLHSSGSLDLGLSAEGLRLLRRHRALRARIIVATQFSDATPPGYATLLRAP